MLKYIVASLDRPALVALYWQLKDWKYEYEDSMPNSIDMPDYYETLDAIGIVVNELRKRRITKIV